MSCVPFVYRRCPVCPMGTESAQCFLFYTDNVLCVLDVQTMSCVSCPGCSGGVLCVLCLQKVPGTSFLSTDNVLCVLDVQEMSSVS